MKKLMALFLVFSLSALSGNLYAKEKRGAKLIIQKKDGQQVRGELIAVKKNSLLLLDSESGADVSVYNNEISSISLKKSILMGAGIGFLIGAIVGIASAEATSNLFGEKETSSEDYFKAVFVAGGIGALVGALLGGVYGVVSGAVSGEEYVTIQIEGRSQGEINAVFQKLRSKARIPDYQ